MAIPCPNDCGRLTSRPIIRDLGQCLVCDRTRSETIVLNAEDFDAFAEMLDRPARINERLQTLFAQPTLLDQPKETP